MKVKVKLLSENAKLPVKKYDSDFCYDVYAADDGVPCKDDEGNDIPNTWSYSTDLSFEVVRDEEVIVNPLVKHYLPEMVIDFKKSPIIIDIDARPRSSVYKTGLILTNCEGTVDESYRGPFKLNFYHVIPELPRYKKGDRIAQIKLGFTLPMNFIEETTLSETERGDGGFGSTGKNDNTKKKGAKK